MIHYDFLVLIDLWKPEVILKDPMPGPHIKRAEASLLNYKLILDNLRHFKFKKVIIENAKLYKDSDIQPPKFILDYFNDKNIKYYVTEGREGNMFHLFQNKCSFLIGGQMWDKCVHGRHYGLVNTFYSGHEVFSSPLITIKEENIAYSLINGKDYDLDRKLSWSKTSDVYVWKVDYIREKTLLDWTGKNLAK